MERFFSVVISNTLRKKCLILKINIGPYSGEASKIQDWLTDQLLPLAEKQLFKGQAPTYNELQGMFFGQYKAWMIGEYKHLYKNDKIGFKNKFGDFINLEKRENPFKYLVAMLRHCALSSKVMPCIVFDNTDHHGQNFQESVYQYAHVSISTMHLAKGLEFRAVVVMACDDEVIPLQARIETVGDDSDLQEVYDTERHLLYVACTRARDHLLISGVNPVSEFLDDFVLGDQGRALHG